MRFTDEMKKTLKTEGFDRQRVRNAVRRIRAKKVTQDGRWQALMLVASHMPTTRLEDYVWNLRAVSHKPWTYIADRIEQTVLAA